MATARAFFDSLVNGTRLSSCHIRESRSILPSTIRQQVSQRTSHVTNRTPHPVPHNFTRPHTCPTWRTHQRPHTCTRAFHTTSPRSAQYQNFRGPRGAAAGLIITLLRRWQARPTFYYEVGGLGLAGGAGFIYNLEEVPISGRRRFNIISPEREEALTGNQAQQVLQQYQGEVLSDWDPRVRQVRRVLERLIPHSGQLARKNWDVHVIDSPEANAFVMPGGHVFVFSGILPICSDDDGLATVLGHEIGHNVAHHSAEKLSLMSIAWLGVFALEALDIAPRNLTSTLVTFALELPASRKQESEADYIGLMMMAESCFDPGAAVAFWGRMERAAEKGGSPPEMMSTHPSSHNRQEKLREWQGRAVEKLEASECGRTAGYMSGFRETTQSLPPQGTAFRFG